MTSPLEPPPRRFNLAEYVLRHADSAPEDDAMHFVGPNGAESLSFGAAADAVQRLRSAIRAAGVEPGDRVLLRLPNAPSYALAFLAATGGGFVAVPASPLLTDHEVEFLLADSGARAVLHDRSLGFDQQPWDGVRIPIDTALQADPLGGKPAATAPDDPAYLVYTSGTTGDPKGVLHAHRAVWGRRPMRDDWTGIRRGDVVLHAGHLNWTYTMGIAVFDSWTVGASSVLYNGPRDPAVWPGLARRFGVSVFAGVPTVYRQLLKYGSNIVRDLTTLRHGLTAGEALSPTLLAEWQGVVGTPLYEALGMSECSTYVSSGPGTPVRPGSPGRPQRGRRVAVLSIEGDAEPVGTGETGLLAVHRSDPGLMLGYWQRPDEEASVYRGDWFFGGDLVHADDDGYLWFHGRHDDLMNAFGYRVSPMEVEHVIEAHPAVREAGVAEVRVRDDVTVIAAFVVPTDAEHPRLAEVRAWCDAELARYKRPREWCVVDRLPRTRSGKVKRSDLRSLPRTQGS